MANAPLPDAPTSAPNPGAMTAGSVDLGWVWREVRKRVFIKLPFSLAVADALAQAVPITLDGDMFVVGFDSKNLTMIPALGADVVRNTVENILRQAAGRPIRFEVIEGATMEDWQHVKERREKAQTAIIAMAEQKVESHHFEDVMNQIVGEVRHRVSQIHDRALPQVRAVLVLDIAESLGDAEEMLFAEGDTREARRAMSRVIDRVATFLEVPSMTLALEIERYRRTQHRRENKVD